MAQTTHKPAWGRSEKALIGVSIAVVAVSAAIIMTIQRQNVLPPIVIPNPTMPSPNAFDYFTKAGTAVVDGTKIGYAVSPTNHTSSSSIPEDHTYTQSEKEALIRENAAALKTFREGLVYPYVNPPARSFAFLFPYYAKERGLARLLSLEGQARAGRRDWNGSVESDLDAIQMGEMIPHGSVLIGSLVGIACESIGRKPIWRTYEHLNAEQSKGAARRLEEISSQEVTFADTLQEEKWMGQASLLEILRTPDWSHEFTALLSSGSGTASEKMLQARLLLTPKRRILENYTSYMDQAIAVTRQPYSMSLKMPAIPNDPISQILFPVFDEARIKPVDNQTQNTLLTTSLALHAYHLDHGTYPASLSALAPVYLKTIHTDPFAVSGPLKYRKTNTGYLLYSIGPDGKDDGGAAILDNTKSAPTHPGASDQRRFVQPDSKGDVVAGVNTF